ncbi:MAG: ABC transporter permease subunit [Synechococcales cyanobacterium M58_A2018_015]|nr:ABC transporter permease subunit [Synechococcales cyanobacterium M58_A2018_015]
MVLGRMARWLLFGGIAVYLLLPILAVVLYAFATRWTANVLPDGYTLQHWFTAFADPRMISALLRTLGLALLVTLIDILIVVPAVYWRWTRNSSIRSHIELTAAIPFSMPYIVIAFGILSLSGEVVPMLQGTVWLLTLAHVAVAFPFLYWAVDGAMAAANIRLLNEAAQTCGAKPFETLRQVVFPNVAPGIATGAMLVFAVSFNEFAIVQILVGSRYETLSLYSLDLLTGTNADFNQLAVITCITFVVVFLVSLASVYWNQGRGQAGSLFQAKQGGR